MEQNKQIKLGNGKKRKDTWLTATICITDAMNHCYEYNGKKYLNVNINIFDQPNQYGKDVNISLNEYKKDTTKVSTSKSGAIKIDDDLGF
jgi:hypothetical protein